MKDELGDRIKSQYEDRTRYYLPRRTFTIIRLDGKAFHTYTRGLNKPFDKDLYEDIDNAIIAMLPEIQGVQFAYTQSDEISLLLTDFAIPTTSAWFDGNIQKIVSVSASTITKHFNKYRLIRSFNEWQNKTGVLDFSCGAEFDARVFTIPDRIEVMNYFVHRNQDCARNAVSMVAQSKFSHKQLHGKSTAEMQEMLMTETGINWANYPEDLKNGRLIVKEEYVTQYGGEVPLPEGLLCQKDVVRTRWVSKSAWKFTQDKDKLLAMIPQYE